LTYEIYDAKGTGLTEASHNDNRNCRSCMTMGRGYHQVTKSTKGCTRVRRVA